MLDHLLWAVPDLTQGMARFETLTGVAPAVGGRHLGYGTRNALVGLGERLYLEILAPDPETPGPLGERVAALAEPSLIAWSASHGDFKRIDAHLGAAGLTSPGSQPLSRVKPDGSLLAWTLLGIDGHDQGSLMPFLIDWGASAHPAATAPQGLALESFALTAPQATLLRRQLSILGLSVPVTEGPPTLTAVLSGPRGQVTLQTTGTLPSQTFGFPATGSQP